ncbi:MAG: hypothetical protein IMZ50_06110 [Candidatus Atribacteria bacterium]|nr:hypothetical protein [Candidatus Atribacteria bacterium]
MTETQTEESLLTMLAGGLEYRISCLPPRAQIVSASKYTIHTAKALIREIRALQAQHADLLAACENSAQALEATRRMLIEAGLQWGDNLAKDIEVARAAYAKTKPVQP